MRPGQQRPGKLFAAVLIPLTSKGFNEAGATTPRKTALDDVFERQVSLLQ